jgi:hypothetical protein
MKGNGLRGRAKWVWVKRATAAFVLLLLSAYTPSGLEAASARAGSPSFAVPKDLPSKGAPGAKLSILMFTEFH